MKAGDFNLFSSGEKAVAKQGVLSFSTEELQLQGV